MASTSKLKCYVYNLNAHTQNAQTLVAGVCKILGLLYRETLKLLLYVHTYATQKPPPVMNGHHGEPFMRRQRLCLCATLFYRMKWMKERGDEHQRQSEMKRHRKWTAWTFSEWTNYDSRTKIAPTHDCTLFIRRRHGQGLLGHDRSRPVMNYRERS